MYQNSLEIYLFVWHFFITVLSYPEWGELAHMVADTKWSLSNGCRNVRARA